MVSVPSGRLVVVNSATPLTSVAVPIVPPWSLKVTVPPFGVVPPGDRLLHCDKTAPLYGYGISGRCSADAPFVPAPTCATLLVVCRLRRDSRRTQGHAEADGERAARRVERVTARRPAKRRGVGPTAATVHPDRAPFSTLRIGGDVDTIGPMPVVAPLKQIAVQIKQAANARTQFPRRIDVPAAVLREPAKLPQQAHLAPIAVSRPSSGTAGHFPLRFRRQAKSPSTQRQRPVPRGPVRRGIRFAQILRLAQGLWSRIRLASKARD